jgi:hypothetical protein
MDPNACLQRIVDAIRGGDADDALAAISDYRGWIAKGGEPGAWVVSADELVIFEGALRDAGRA